MRPFFRSDTVENTTIRYAHLDSSLGPLLLAASDTGLCRIQLPRGDQPPAPASGWTKDPPFLSEALRQLREYFAGLRQDFDLPLAPAGTAFQQRVWRALQEIPYGTVVSYADIARRIGQPTASRAVGAANGANPLPIVIPCHRVVASSGQLGGYGGGLDRKQLLLDLEKSAVLV